MLRLWAWERSRGLVVQIDFWLPNESDLLYIGVRVQNPSDQVVPVYWWSNIAVEQSPGTRVVDFFFELPPVDRLTRHRRQEWLAPGKGGNGYAEIQAGLARTQMEHLPLPAETSWSWLEAYGRLEVGPEVVHADDWSAVTAGVDAVCELRLPATDLVERYDWWHAVADGEPGEALFTGSGWGALEIARTNWQVSPGTPFAKDSQWHAVQQALGADEPVPATYDFGMFEN